MAALKEAATQDSSEASLRKLPPAERVSREKRRQQRLAGISITAEMCPSHHLCDVENTIYETGVIQWKYRAPSKLRANKSCKSKRMPWCWQLLSMSRRTPAQSSSYNGLEVDVGSRLINAVYCLGQYISSGCRIS